MTKNVFYKKYNKIGILFGTFDIVHPGHLNLLNQAEKKCDYLVVVIARDKTVLQVKGRLPKNKENKRLLEVRKQKLAKSVVLGNLRNKYAVIKKYQPDIIFLGYDQKAFTENLELRLKEMKIKAGIIRLKPFKPKIYKTSKIYENNNLR